MVLRTSGALAILQRDSSLQIRRRAVRLEAECRIGLELRRRAHAADIRAVFKESAQAQDIDISLKGTHKLTQPSSCAAAPTHSRTHALMPAVDVGAAAALLSVLVAFTFAELIVLLAPRATAAVASVNTAAKSIFVDVVEA